MVALQYVTRLIELEEKEDMLPVVEDLKELNEELEIYLKEK